MEWQEKGVPLFWDVQVSPPFDELRMTPRSPAAQPYVEFLKRIEERQVLSGSVDGPEAI